MKTNNNISSIKEISSESTKEEIAEFFNIKFNFSEKIKENIIKEDISGDILLDLKDKEFKQLGLKNIQIQLIRDYLSENYETFIDTNKKIDQIDLEKNIKRLIDSEKLKDIDIKNFLNLAPDKISKIELNLGQTKKLQKYLKKYKQYNKEKNISSNKNKVSQTKNNEQMENINIIQKSTISLKEENKRDNPIFDKNENSSFIWSMIPNLNLSGLWSLYSNKETNHIQNNKIIDKENFKINENKRNNKNKNINTQGNILSYIEYQDIPCTNIEPFYKDSHYNIFFLLVINQEYYNSSLSFYENNSCIQLWKIIVNYSYIFLINEEIENNDYNKKRVILIQIPSDKPIHRLWVSLFNKKMIKNNEIK